VNKHPLTLELTNFRRFAKTHAITFEPGLTIINGPNGAGKSTLIEAFIYALFGPKYRQDPTDLRTDSLNGPVCVECKLCIDGQEVHITRSGTTAELRINNVVQVQAGPGSGKAVTGRVTALLGGLTRGQFERTYVALQGDTAGLVADDASPRRKIIEKILQLEVLTKAIELQVKRCDEAKGGVISLGYLICDNLSLGVEVHKLIQSFQGARTVHTRSQHTHKFLQNLEKVMLVQRQKFQEAESKVAEQQVQVSTLKVQYQEIQTSMEQALQAYKQQEECQKKYNEYREHIATLDGKVEQSKLDIQTYEDAICKAEKCVDASKAYIQLQAEITHHEKRLERIPLIENCYNSFVQAQTELNALDSRLGELTTLDEELRLTKEQETQGKQQVDMLRNEDPTQSHYEEWQKQNSRLEYETQQNKEALEQLTRETSDARCPTCNQRFVEHTPEHRIHHLTIWLSETLPPLQEQLYQQKRHIDEKKKRWEQAKQQAEQEYSQLQRATIIIEKKVLTRTLLSEQRNSAYSKLFAQQQAWLALAEDIPDSQQTVMLRKNLEGLIKQATVLKTQADTYAQLPFLHERLQDKQKDQERLLLDKKALLEQQSNLAYDPKDFQATEELLGTMQEKGTQIQNQLYQVEMALLNAQSIAQQMQKDIDTTQIYHDRFGTNVQEYYREERLCEHLEEFKKHFFEANTGEVMRRTTELLMYAITDQSILGVKFDKDEFQYLDASYIARPISRLSGGEKALVGLCLRIALAEQAQTIIRTGRVKFLVLDEVLSSLDEERCEAVKRIFADVLQRGIFEHILMITHLDTVKQSWHSHGLAVQKLDGKMSTVISVSPGEVPINLTEEIEV